MLTHGAVQSNHVRQTAAAAAYLGLDGQAILEERVQGAPAEYNESGKVLLDQLFGIPLHRVPSGTAMDTALEALAARLREQGRRPCVIAGGWPCARWPCWACWACSRRCRANAWWTRPTR